MAVLSFIAAAFPIVDLVVQGVSFVADAITNIVNEINPSFDFRGQEGKVAEINDLVVKLAGVMDLSFTPFEPDDEESFREWVSKIEPIMDVLHDVVSDKWMTTISAIELGATDVPTSTEAAQTDSEATQITSSQIATAAVPEEVKDEARAIIEDMKIVEDIFGDLRVDIEKKFTRFEDDEVDSVNNYHRSSIKSTTSQGIDAMYRVSPGKMIAPGGIAPISKGVDWIISRDSTSLTTHVDNTGSQLAWLDPLTSTVAPAAAYGSVDYISSGAAATPYGNFDGADEAEIASLAVTSGLKLCQVSWSVATAGDDTITTLTDSVLSSVMKNRSYRWLQKLNFMVEAPIANVNYMMVFVAPASSYGEDKIISRTIISSPTSKVNFTSMDIQFNLYPTGAGVGPAFVADPALPVLLDVYAIPMWSGVGAGNMTAVLEMSVEFGDLMGRFVPSVAVDWRDISYHDDMHNPRRLSSGSATFAENFGKMSRSNMEDPNLSVRALYIDHLGASGGKLLGEAIIMIRIWAATIGVDIEAAYTAVGLAGTLGELQTPANWLDVDGPFRGMSSSQINRVLMKLSHDLTILRKHMGREKLGLDILDLMFSLGL